LKNSNANPKVKIMKEKGVGYTQLVALQSKRGVLELLDGD
jgi:hypothetical protein